MTPGQPIDLSLAVRIALAVSLSGGFLIFVAEYARLRGELIHAERHLNLSRAGRLATTKLGKDVLYGFRLNDSTRRGFTKLFEAAKLGRHESGDRDAWRRFLSI